MYIGADELPKKIQSINEVHAIIAMHFPLQGNTRGLTLGPIANTNWRESMKSWCLRASDRNGRSLSLQQNKG
jgi:hypothetical protein